MCWVKRALVGVVLAMLLLVGMVWLVTGTPQGTGWLLERANDFIPGELTTGRVEGSLLGELRLKQLRYETPEMRVRVGEALFSWSPGELFRGVLHLRALKVNQVDYVQLKTPQEKPSQPLQLTDIELPLEIRVDLVQVSALSFTPSPDARPLLVDLAQLQADWTPAGLKLSRLVAKLPDLVNLSAQGRLQPTGAYLLDFSLNWDLLVKDMPRVSGKGDIKGDLDKLVLGQQLSGDIGARLTATAENVLGELSWTTDLVLDRLPEDYLSLKLPENLRINLKARGDLHQADGSLDLQGGKAADQDKTPPMGLHLLARVAFEDLRFDLRGDWTALQWPLAGLAQFQSPKGKLKLAGIPEDYRIDLRASVLGQDIPQGDWQLAGKGSRRQLNLDSLTGNTLDGRISGKGLVQWQPELAWDMKLQAGDINPGILQRDYPGKLNLRLSSKGRVKDGKPDLQAVIEELDGSLNDKPVTGKGEVRVQGNVISVQSLELGSGRARLQADGSLGERLDLNWTVSVPDMADLVPGGAGSLQGSGHLQGSREKPVVDGDMQLRELALAGIGASRLDASFSLGLDEGFHSRASISGSDLLAAGQKIGTLDFLLDGPLSAQDLNLRVEQETRQLRFAARGALQLQERAWTGEIRELSLHGADEGKWNLEQSGAVALRPDKISLAPLCLRDGDARLCMEADRFPDRGSASLVLKGFSVERARPWLPPEIAEFTGMLQADVKLDLAEPITAHAEVDLSPGVVSYLDASSEPIRLEHRDGKLTAVLDDKGLDARWRLKLGPHSVSGDLRMPREALDRDPMTAPMEGQLKLAVTELGLVTAFVPDIEKMDGHLDVALKLAGSPAEPRISGKAILEAAETVIPRAGLELRDMRLEVQGSDGRELRISGGVVSGEGALKLAGTASLDPEQGWPVQLTVKGERFRLADLPEAQVLITPDISVENNKEKLGIRGMLGVPKAVIQINDLPPGSKSTSSDVVVLSDEGKAEEPRPSRVDLEVTVVLGEKVHFGGFGLNVDLGGRLTVIQKGGKIPMGAGELKILSGSYRAYGQDLNIDEGRISWAGGPLDNPLLRLQASRRIDDVTVGVKVAGTAKKPRLQAFSTDPDITEKDALSMLLTGQKTGNLADATVYAGKQITPDLSVGVNLGGGEEGTEFVTRYRLRDNINLEGTSSSQKSGGSINYTLEIE